MDRLVIQQALDKVAISASALCMLHCLLTPLLIIVVPVMSATFIADESFHRILVFLIVPISLFALFIGCHRHKDRVVMLLGCLGLASLVVVALVGHDLFGELGEKLATVLSGIILVLGHIRNYVLCRKTACDS